MSEAILIAGPNGAGKTTFARQIVPAFHSEAVFLNADEIRGEAAPFAHPVAAGREILRRLQMIESTRASFAIETTLASRMYLQRINNWKSRGYRCILHFIELTSEDVAVNRVAARIAAGGHSVPEVDIRRRFHRGKALFHGSYKAAVDAWYHWISEERGLRFVEHGR